MWKISKIKKSELCIGCGYCASLFDGKMVINARGFLEPSGIDNEETDVCPGMEIKRSRLASKGSHPVWGNIKSMFAGHASNHDIRYQCSSGGGITAILIYLLDNKFVDAVVHIKADDTIPYANKLVVSRTAEEIISASGSRYSPSSPLSNIHQLAQGNEKYAFVGKPCDIYALKKAKENNRDIQNTFPILISFMCGGIPSLAGALAVAELLGIDEHHIKSYRYRGYGCPGFLTIRTMDGKTHKVPYHKAWGKILNKFSHLRCKVCADGVGEFADIVCADFWPTDSKGFPIFDESDGTNLFMARTELGEMLIEQCIKLGLINYLFPVKTSELKNIQPFQYYRKTTVFSRIFSLGLSNRPAPTYRGMNLIKLSVLNPANQVKGAIGMFIKRNNHRRISY